MWCCATKVWLKENISKKSCHRTACDNKLYKEKIFWKTCCTCYKLFKNMSHPYIVTWGKLFKKHVEPLRSDKKNYLKNMSHNWGVHKEKLYKKTCSTTVVQYKGKK